MDISVSSMSISTESVESRGDSRKSSNLSDLEEVIDGAASHQCADSSEGRNSYASSHQHDATEGRNSYETGFLRGTTDDKNSFAIGHHHGAVDDPNSNRCPYLNADSVNHNLTTTSDDLGLSDDSLGSYDNLGSDEKGRYEDLLDNSAYSKYFKFTYTNSEIFHLAEEAEQLVRNNMEQLGAAEHGSCGRESSCQASDEESEGGQSDGYNEDEITRIENIGFNPERSRRKESLKRRMTLDLKPSKDCGANTSSMTSDLGGEIISSPEAMASLTSPDSPALLSPLHSEANLDFESDSSPPSNAMHRLSFSDVNNSAAQSSLEAAAIAFPSATAAASPLTARAAKTSFNDTVLDSPKLVLKYMNLTSTPKKVARDLFSEESPAASVKAGPSFLNSQPNITGLNLEEMAIRRRQLELEILERERLQKLNDCKSSDNLEDLNVTLTNHNTSADLLSCNVQQVVGLEPVSSTRPNSCTQLNTSMEVMLDEEGDKVRSYGVGESDNSMQYRRGIIIDSLDDCSSSEEFNRIVDSDIWDQESMKSEYHYEESIDEERARNLINFGDDYRNFLSSLSSSQSSIVSKSTRRRRRRHRDKVYSKDSCSEAEYSSVYSVLQDSEREYSTVYGRTQDIQGRGFASPQQLEQYAELLSICGENIETLVEILQNLDLRDPLVSRRKGRELRILLNRWTKLKDRIQENIHHANLYSAIREDILKFRQDLTNLLTRVEDSSSLASEDQGALEVTLDRYKDGMSELSNFKSVLFQLNLSVHNLLAEVSSSIQQNTQASIVDPQPSLVQQAQDLQGQVVQLYTLWDSTHHRLVSGLSTTQDSLCKLSTFETELSQLQNSLKKDVKTLRDARKRRGLNHLKSSSTTATDSGISDSYDVYDADLPDQREQQLQRLKMMAKSLESNLHLTTSMKSISSTLDSTSRQLNHLKKIARISRKASFRAAPCSAASGASASPIVAANTARINVTNVSTGIRIPVTTRRGRVLKYSMLFNLMFFGLFVLSWAFQPRCCDSFSSISFLPQYSYVNGPPPT